MVLASRQRVLEAKYQAGEVVGLDSKSRQWGFHRVQALNTKFQSQSQSTWWEMGRKKRMEIVEVYIVYRCGQIDDI